MCIDKRYCQIKTKLILSDILHIGYPKTASTWFQEVFYPNLKNAKYIHRHRVQDLVLKPGAFEWNLDECRQQLTNNPARIAICEELLLGRLRAGGVKHFLTKEVANRLFQIFPNTIFHDPADQFQRQWLVYWELYRAFGALIHR